MIMMSTTKNHKVVDDNDRWTMVFRDTMIVAIDNEDCKMIMTIVRTNVR